MLESIYGVPDYLLVGTERPNLPELLLDYRKEHLAPLETSPRGLAAYFRRLDTANTLGMLSNALGMTPTKWLDGKLEISGLRPSLSSIQAEMAFDPTDRANFENPDLALRKLRYGVESLGSLCLLVEAPPVDYRGLFSHTDEKWGLCLVNKRTFKAKARMFTVAHELAHFLTNQPGASDPLITENAVELECNRFASEFLAPSIYFEDLRRQSYERYIGVDDRIDFISSRSLLSKGATAYRLNIEGHLSRKEYRDWLVVNKMPLDYGAEDTAEDLAETGGGGNWAYNVVSDLGLQAVVIVKTALEKGLVDDIDAGRLLNARGETLGKVFETAERRIGEIHP